MRTYVSPIGYNSTSVTRPILSRGVDTGDRVVLIRPEAETDDKRAREAIGDVERMLTEIEPDVSLSTERIPHGEFSAAVLACSDVIRASDGDIVVNLSGGARDILVPFVVATITHVSLVHTVLFFSDIDGAVREWALPRLTTGLSDKTVQTLATIGEGGAQLSIPDLTERIGKSKSTVTRHVNHLDECGAVHTETEGKTKFVRISLTGQLLLRARE